MPCGIPPISAHLLQYKPERSKNDSVQTVFSYLTECQMALCFVASSLNKNGGLTPGFIPVYLTGMSDSSMPSRASPISVLFPPLFTLKLCSMKLRTELLCVCERCK